MTQGTIREKVFDKDCLEVATTDDDEVKTDVQKGSSAMDTSRPLSSANPPISVTAPKPLSSNMDSRYVFPTRTNSFA